MKEKTINIESSYLSFAELKSILVNTNLLITDQNTDETRRGVTDMIDTVIIAAVISGSMIGGPHWIANVIKPIILKIRKKFKKTKPKLNISLETEELVLDLDINLPDLEFEDQLKLIDKLKEIPIILITKKDEE